MDEDETDKMIKKSMFHSNEDLPKGVTYDGECYIIDDDFEGWYGESN